MSKTTADPIALKRTDLMPLEEYVIAREAFRKQAIAERKARRFVLGDHFAIHFENRLTVQYQVQEMLRVERIFEAEAIEEELASYNPLISQGQSIRGTLFIEFAQVEERQHRLQQMVGIEHCFWLRVGGGDRIMATSNEDMERSTEEKTAAVHFMRFDLSDEDVVMLRQGAPVSAGVDYDNSAEAVDAVPMPEGIRAALLSDLAAD